MTDLKEIKQKLLEWLYPNKGRVEALPFLVITVIFSVAAVYFFGLSLNYKYKFKDPFGEFYSGFLFLLCIYFVFAVAIKRLRTLNWPAWIVLGYLFTPLNLALFLYLIFGSPLGLNENKQSKILDNTSSSNDLHTSETAIPADTKSVENSKKTNIEVDPVILSNRENQSADLKRSMLGSKEVPLDVYFKKKNESRN